MGDSGKSASSNFGIHLRSGCQRDAGAFVKSLPSITLGRSDSSSRPPSSLSKDDAAQDTGWREFLGLGKVRVLKS